MPTLIHRARRIRSLIHKEARQIVRDPSSIMIAFVLPMILLGLFTYGVSLDLRHISIGVVVERMSAEAESLLAGFLSSGYFQVHLAEDRRLLEPLLVTGQVQAVVVIPADFADRTLCGQPSPVQVLVRATEANTGELVLNYIEGTLRHWQQKQAVEKSFFPIASGVRLEPRIWFNPEADYLAAMLPGSIAVIMTLIGTMLTSLVVAREWERGTMESLLSMGLNRTELFLGKFFPYFLLGMLAMELISVVGVVFLGVPFRGSWWLLHLVTAVYLGYALGLGLVISSVTRSQFVATQAALIIGFLPSFLLSGLVFEIQSMPLAIRVLTKIFPPRYFVTVLRTLFLAGDVWEVVVPNTAILFGFAVVLLIWAIRATRTRLA
ncbi:MAG: ABC transporter permease [Thermoguttaceae bacterium]|nr:ABC transporter permease [Thermoguttaceae bacterium]